MGGPRDRTPPKLLLATPADQTRNFKVKIIKLDFDEYFKLSNQFSEITISPAPEKTPDFKTKGKSLLIVLKDTLQKNTTYVINFGKAIQDVNESNVLKNFTYVFSTGPHIDSLTMTGTVYNTQTQERERDATVMLFPLSRDSAMFGKKKPSIFTSTDTAGNFTLSNLHDGDYRIYALKEKSPDRIFNRDDEQIAFLKKPIHLTTDTSGISLNLFTQVPAKLHVDKSFANDGKMVFVLNQQYPDLGVKINYPAGFDDTKIVEYGLKKDTVSIYPKSMDFDSVSVSFTNKDKILDTVSLMKPRKETYSRVVILNYNTTPDGRLKPGTDLAITVSTPVKSFDVSRIILTEDSVQKTNFTLTKDPLSERRFIFKYPWKQLARYQITFNEGTFEGIYGDKNKRFPKSLILDKPESYGTMNITVSVPDSAKSYVVELLNDGRQVRQTNVIKKTTTVTYKDFPVGKYRMRIIYDRNNNGKWDSGNVKQKIYPEQILLLPNIFTFRPNWEEDVPIDVPREVINP